MDEKDLTSSQSEMRIYVYALHNFIYVLTSGESWRKGP